MGQLALLKTAVEKTVDGIEMGVLEDGTAFLTGRSLARLCGVSHASVSVPAAAWNNGDRTSKAAQFLTEQGIKHASLYGHTTVSGIPAHAYPEDVCAAFIYYFATASKAPTDEAKRALKILTTAGLRLYIYGRTGYVTGPSIWTQFHDRLLKFPVPEGYFGVFRELSQFVLTSITHGLVVDSHTVPDGSVGSFWSKHWLSQNLTAKHGAPIDIPLYFPDYFPQAKANGYMTAKAYPEDALGDFRKWLRGHYIPKHFPAYLAGKAKAGALPPSGSLAILTAMGAPAAALPAAPEAAPLFFEVPKRSKP